MKHCTQSFFYALLILLSASLPKSVYAQQLAFRNQSVQEEQRQRALQTVLKELESQYEVNFTYQSDIIENKQVKAPLENKQRDLENTLEELLRPLELLYQKVDERLYLIYPSQKPLEVPKLERQKTHATDTRSSAITGQYLPTLANWQDRNTILEQTITGQVTDLSTDETLPGVNILVKGTTIGTVTDIDGNYRLTAPDNAGTLVFSSVGYTSEEVAIEGQTVINMSLSPDIQSLGEVVVVGYGTQENRKVTTAISTVSGEDIAQQPVVSADQALQGQVSGVNIVGAGIPGANPTVRIRGLGSVLNSDPLFVIDGVPVGQRALNDIHPNNIEDMSVLKDAASTAIYGSRGANGVILITTKRGKIGKPTVSARAYYGIDNLPESSKYDLLNTDQYINFAQNTFGVSAPRFDDYDFDRREFRAGTPSEEFIGVETDWQDAVLNGGSRQDYYADFSGGNEQFTYNVGGGYYDQDGLLIDTYFRRISFNTNFQAKLGERFRLGQSLIVARSETEQEAEGPIVRAIQMMPYIPVRDPSRPGGFRATDFADNADPVQPVLNTVLNDDSRTYTKLLATLFTEYNILEGLNAKIQVGVENTYTQVNNFVPTYAAGEVAFNVNPNPEFTRESRTYLSPVITPTLDYSKALGDHYLSAVVGYETQRFNNEQIQAQSTFLPNENVRNPATSPVDRQQSSVSVQNTLIESWFGRVNYDYQDKYLLGASVRRDKSSVFAPENNVGIFPAFSAGWRISEESFFNGLSNVVTDLKIRGSWGQNGNTSINAYTWDPTIFSNLVYLQGGGVIQQPVAGVAVNTLFNRDLQWETIIKTNIGLDAEFFNGKLYATVEWFDNRSEDLIIQVPLPNSAGFDGTTFANVGSVENRGLEIALGYSEVESELNWSINSNVTFIQNEVTSLGGGEDANIAGPVFQNTASPSTRAEVGEPIGFYYGWQTDGIFQSYDEIRAHADQGSSPFDENGNLLPELDEEGNVLLANRTAPGDIRFRDLDGNGVIDGEDRTNLGHYLPDVTVGLNGSANYKGFDLRANFIGSFGFEILHANRYYTEGMTRLFNMGTPVLDAWSPTNTDTDIPRARAEASTSNARLSDRWVEDGDFVRLRFLTLGYTIPIKEGNTISKLRVYGQAQNLFTITGYTGYDPEVQGNGGNNALFFNGIDASVIPNPRTFILGVEISL